MNLYLSRAAYMAYWYWEESSLEQGESSMLRLTFMNPIWLLEKCCQFFWKMKNKNAIGLFRLDFCHFFFLLLNFCMQKAEDIFLFTWQEFDSSYGPAWHCIVGTSFGSYVTHSTGGFLYFSIDKVYILLFKTAVEPLDHWFAFTIWNLSNSGLYEIKYFLCQFICKMVDFQIHKHLYFVLLHWWLSLY